MNTSGQEKASSKSDSSSGMGLTIVFVSQLQVLLLATFLVESHEEEAFV